jgi:hypothetical protein
MSFHRVVFVALATLFTMGMTSMASACCDWGYSAPVTYAQIAPVAYGGYGGYGGCGGCGAPTAALVYAQPVAPAPIAVNTCCGGTAWGGTSYWGNSGCCGNGWTSNWNTCGNCGQVSWSVGCGNCGAVGWGGGGWGGGWTPGRCNNCGASPLYVVNQGPVYSGPGLMQPYATYSPDTAYAPASNYPYVPGYGYGPAPVPPPYYGHLYYHPHYAYRAPMYQHYGPMPYRGNWHRPMGY